MPKIDIKHQQWRIRTWNGPQVQVDQYKTRNTYTGQIYIILEQKLKNAFPHLHIEIHIAQIK